MNKLAKLFFKADVQQIVNLIRYYNVNCVDFVKKERRYCMEYGDNWCAMFVSVLADIKGFKVKRFPYEVSVFEMVKIASEQGDWKLGVNGIRVGDLIVYDWSQNGVPNHVGIVDAIEGGTLVAIEGNKGNTVGYRSIDVNSRVIMGYIKM